MAILRRTRRSATAGATAVRPPGSLRVHGRARRGCTAALTAGSRTTTVTTTPTSPTTRPSPVAPGAAAARRSRSRASPRSCCCGPRTRARRCSPLPGSPERPRCPGGAPASSGWSSPRSWSARPCWAGTTTSSTASGTARHERRGKPVASGLLDPGTAWFTLACAVLLLVPLSIANGVVAGLSYLVAVAVGLLGNLVLRPGWLSWLPWAASYALLPAFLSYGGWGGDATGNPPEIVDHRARRPARRRRARAGRPARAGGRQRGRPAAPAAAARLRLGAAKAAGARTRSGRRSSSWPCCWPVSARRPLASSGPGATARLCAVRAPHTSAARARRTCEGLRMHLRRTTALSVAQPAARRPAAVVVRVQLRDRPALHAGGRHERPRRLRRRSRRRHRLGPGRLRHLHRLALQQRPAEVGRPSSRWPARAATPCSSTSFSPVTIDPGRLAEPAAGRRRPGHRHLQGRRGPPLRVTFATASGSPWTCRSWPTTATSTATTTPSGPPRQPVRPRAPARATEQPSGSSSSPSTSPSASPSE